MAGDSRPPNVGGQSSTLHNRAFGTADWAIPQQPSGQQPLGSNKKKRKGPGPSEHVSVHVGPLREADRKQQQQQQQQRQQHSSAKFIKAKSFAGAKAGYVFQNGPKGLGYYLEKGNAAVSKQQQAANQPKHGQSEAARASLDAEQPTHSVTDATEDADDMQPTHGEYMLILKSSVVSGRKHITLLLFTYGTRAHMQGLARLIICST